VNEACATCRFYYPFPEGSYGVDANGKEHRAPAIGHCRRKAPSMDPVSSGARWPIVVTRDWCGEWEERKT